MLKSHLEIIEQAQLYLNTVSVDEYSLIMSPNFTSSAGAHMRHIIDHYLAVISGMESELIDYDVRDRGSKVELSPIFAQEKLVEIAQWIESLSEDDLQRSITLTTEVSITKKKVQKVPSSIARELIFVSSHALHHYAMISQISIAQKSILSRPSTKAGVQPNTFGLAPATATFIRKNN